MIDKFRTELGERIQVAAKDVEAQARQVERVKKRLADEEDAVRRLGSRIETLTESAGDASKTVNGLDKFKTSMKKLGEEQRATVATVETLLNDVLPGAQKKLRQLETARNHVVDKFLSEKRREFEKRMCSLFSELTETHEDFYEAARRLCNENGAPFKAGPMRWSEKVGRYRLIVTDKEVSVRLLPPSNWPKEPADVPQKGGNAASEPRTASNGENMGLDTPSTEIGDSEGAGRSASSETQT